MSQFDESALRDQIERLSLLHRVGVALTKERNRDRLIETILLEAMRITLADGGTLYIRDDQDCLRFEMMHSETLGIALGGTTGKSTNLPPIPMYDPESGAPNHDSVATHTALLGETVNIADAYEAEGFDFTGTKAFDAQAGYRSQSFLTVPLIGNDERVIAVIQLINARQHGSDEVVAFTDADQSLVEALASQAAVALENQMLLDGQKALLESFIQMIAAAIDAKSPYTGGHCERVPELTLMLARAACDANEGPFADFDLDEDEWYELRIGAWLHDCGKVVTPVHVMDKATKLETIADRIQSVRARFEVLRRDARIALLEGTLDQAGHDAEVARLDDDLAFLEKANLGAEFIKDEDRARIHAIAERKVMMSGQARPLLDEDEVKNLTIGRGTLTQEERLIINGHMVETIRMLEALPFPPHLARVPEYAGGHHEKMDGTGYPKGLYAGDMSTPARMMAIADVFEALTAQDRPYKKGKTLSESMRIMGFMKADNHLDPELFDLFLTSGVYREYAARFLPPELIDEVDEAKLLAIQPKPYSLPPEPDRARRWESFLPEYLHLLRPTFVPVG